MAPLLHVQPHQFSHQLLHVVEAKAQAVKALGVCTEAEGQQAANGHGGATGTHQYGRLAHCEALLHLGHGGLQHPLDESLEELNPFGC